ncbi:hypothetical protein HELRODRAFT_125459, partial [Helobdella robusta]|uniref:G-protein coupled receptors family 1 profile domain-containing protein n=1 Tax=Helobdella robusta TaxID=6412 RepID=T1EH61_HELRO
DHLYYQIYYAARVVLIHFVPCSLLIILNALLINTMRQAKKRRLQLLKMNRRSECRRLAESTLTTFMLVVVVGVFLIVEVPMAVVFTMMMFDNSLKLELFSPNLSEHLTGIANLFILVSYPSNFFIYCVMSTRFRDTFKQLICCSRSRSSSHNSCCSSS